jgi:hypothetical protein
MSFSFNDRLRAPRWLRVGLGCWHRLLQRLVDADRDELADAHVEWRERPQSGW